jgi:hypothetical protein
MTWINYSFDRNNCRELAGGLPLRVLLNHNRCETSKALLQRDHVFGMAASWEGPRQAGPRVARGQHTSLR